MSFRIFHWMAVLVIQMKQNSTNSYDGSGY